MQDLSIIDLFTLLCIIGALFCFFAGGRVRYLYDQVSQHKRYCTKCSQQQIQPPHHGVAGAWVSVGPIMDQACNCHHDTCHPDTP